MLLHQDEAALPLFVQRRGECDVFAREIHVIGS